MKLTDMKTTDIGAIEGVYLTGTGVTFLVRGAAPKWPEECVACGKYCAETSEFYSRRTVRFMNLQWTVKSRSFRVPVHQTGRSCLVLLKQPVLPWVWLMAMLAALGVGSLMSYLAHPISADRVGAFIVFGSLGFCLALPPVIFSFPPFLEIDERQYGSYYASFKDKGYAQRFSALNPQLVQFWSSAGR